MHSNQRSYQRWLDKRIYKTVMKFWAVLGSRGCRENKGSGPIMSNFLGWFFQLFVVKKKIKKFENIVASALKSCIEKSLKKIFWGGKNLFFLGLILFWNKSVIHRGPYSMVSVRSLPVQYRNFCNFVEFWWGFFDVFMDKRNTKLEFLFIVGSALKSWWT